MIATVIAMKSGERWLLECLEFRGALSEVADPDDAGVMVEAIAWVANVPPDEIELNVVVVGSRNGIPSDSGLQ